MDQISRDKTLENITKAENILIAVSENTGLDGQASGLALYLSCQKLGKNVSIIAKAPSAGDATLLYGVDQIGKSPGKTNLVVVVEDAVENIDKVTYFLEGSKLKIVIHPFSGSRGISQEQLSYEQIPTKPNLIFTIGFKSSEDLIKVITHEQNLDSNTWIISINREELQQKFAQVNISSPEATCLSELTAQFIQDLALPVDEDISYNLFVGISHSTENFSPSKVTQNSFQIASWLIKFGAGRASLAGGPKWDSLAGITTKSPFIQSPQPVIRHEPIFPKPLSTPGLANQNPSTSPFDLTGIEDVEPQKISEKDWLKPPKIYRGSKSFDREN